MRNAFTLIEVLVVVAVMALLVAILVPSLSAAREASRVSVCASNLRQCFLACRMYADAHRGIGPSIGRPYFELPNWSLQVQAYAGRSRRYGTNIYRADSVLVCPTIQAFYPEEMNRTYAMNTTGHALNPSDAWSIEDPDSYDRQPPYNFGVIPPRTTPLVQTNYAQIKFDRVTRPAEALLLVDSAWFPDTPRIRTASMLDFRNPTHVTERLGMFHRNRRQFNGVAFDGSCQAYSSVKDRWRKPLP